MNLKRILLLTGVFFVLFLTSITSVKAQGWDIIEKTQDAVDKTTSQLESGQASDQTSVEKLFGGEVDPDTGEIAGGTLRLTLATINQELNGYRVKNIGTGETVWKPGAIGQLASGISYLYKTPPATTETYVADLMKSANIATPAYAQGIGFASLSPILEVWKIFRNIAYFFFVLIILFIGFAIMFRKKMGQTAITAQQAIPQIVIAMLAVTFSYAIAGFLIDLMYLFMYFMAGIFNYTEGLNYGIFGLGWKLIINGAKGGYETVSEIVDNFISLPGIFDDVAKPIEWLSGLTASLIVSIAIVVATFKLFFELVKTYITIIISIVMSPLLLMTGAIPGKNVFAKWIQGLIGNLAAFPTVLMVLILYEQLTKFGTDSGGFLPPYLTGGSRVAGVMPFIIGLGLLMGLPEAVQKVKKALGAEEGGAFGDVLKAGWERANKQRNKGVGIMAAGTGVVGGGLAGGAYGMLRGGGDMNTRLRRAGRNAGIGAVAGGIGAPLVASGAPIKFARGTIESGVSLAQRTAAERYLPDLLANIGVAPNVNSAGGATTDSPIGATLRRARGGSGGAPSTPPANQPNPTRKW